MGLRTFSPMLVACERRSADLRRRVRGCQTAAQITTRRNANGVFDCCRATAGTEVVRANRAAGASSKLTSERALVGIYISAGAPHVAWAEVGGCFRASILRVPPSEVVAFPLASAAPLAADTFVAQVNTILEEADEGRLPSTQQVAVGKRVKRFEERAEQRPALTSPCSTRCRCNRREQMLPKRVEDREEATGQHLRQVIACCSTRASLSAIAFAWLHTSPDKGVELRVR